MPDFRFLSSASVLASHYSASVSSFPLSSRFRLTVASPVRPFRSRFSGLSPFFPTWFPMPSFPVLRTRLPVCFLSSFPASLPQLFHRCFPSFPLPCVRFSSGLFCSPSAFFRLLPLASDYSAFRSFLSLLPVLPCRRFLRCPSVPCVPDLSSSVSPVSMRPFRFRYSASCVSFLRFTVSCHRHYAASGLLFPARPLPFAFTLGSGYSACPFRTFRFASDLAYISTATIICQHLFFAFLDY